MGEEHQVPSAFLPFLARLAFSKRAKQLRRCEVALATERRRLDIACRPLAHVEPTKLKNDRSPLELQT